MTYQEMEGRKAISWTAVDSLIDKEFMGEFPVRVYFQETDTMSMEFGVYRARVYRIGYVDPFWGKREAEIMNVYQKRHCWAVRIGELFYVASDNTSKFISPASARDFEVPFSVTIPIAYVHPVKELLRDGLLGPCCSHCGKLLKT